MNCFTQISLIFTLALSSLALAGESTFKPLSEAPNSPEEEFFKVVNGESKLQGHVIKVIVVKPEYLTASYKNDSKQPLFPQYTVRTYNRYGYLLGSDKVGASIFGGSSKLEIGDVGGEKIHLDLIDIASVFKHTKLDLPADFFDVAWISLAESNTKIAEQVGADQPATAPESKPEGDEKPQPDSEGRPQ